MPRRRAFAGLGVAALAVSVLGVIPWLGTPAQAQTPGGNGSIAFERYQPGTQDTDIYRVSTNGGQPQLVWTGGGAPHWSPDGRELAFETCLDPPTCDTAVALMDSATGAVHGFSMPDPNVFTACVIWTPDATRLACEGQGQSDPARNGIYTIRATDGGGLAQITSNPGGDDLPLDYSPDGSRILFARTDPSRPPRANQALFVGTADGHQIQRVTPWGFTDNQASWSPNGHTIVFGTSGSLYSVHPDGTGFAKIALQGKLGSKPLNAFDVGWSPDGTRLVFSMAPSGNQHPGVYTATPDGRDVRAVTISPTADHHSNWGAVPSP